MDESRPRGYCYGGGIPGGTLRASRHSTSVALDHRRSQMSARRAPFAASKTCPGSRAPISLRVRGEAEPRLRRGILRPLICCFSGEGCRKAISYASDSPAAHCYATIAARRHIGTEPKP